MGIKAQETNQENKYPFQNNTIVCNLLDKDFFLDFYRQSKILKDIKKEVELLFPFFDYFVEDLFYILYKIVITFKEDHEVSQEVLSHQIFINEVLETENIKKLRRRTKGNLANSYTGLYYILQWVLEIIKDENIEELIKKRNALLEKKEKEKNNIDKEEKTKEELEEKIEELVNAYKTIDKPKINDEKFHQGEIQETEEGEGSSKEMLNQEEFQALDYEKDEAAQGPLAGSTDEYTPNNSLNQEDMESTQDNLYPELKVKLEAVSKKIEEYEERLKELEKDENIVLDEYKKSIEEKAIEDVENKAIFMIEDLEDKLESLGLKTSEMKNLSFDFIINLSETFKRPQLKALLNKIGRKRKLARKGQIKKKKMFKGIQSQQTLSDDLDNIMESEYLNLGLDIEELELDFYNRYLNARLSTWQGARVEKKKKGPIIICYDGSASMEGGKIEETKAHLFAFMEIAKKQKRKILTIQFSSAQEDLFIKELEPNSNNIQEKIDIIEGFISKGTDFKKPLEKSIEYITNYNYKDADIIFMTDGESTINKDFKEKFIKIKKKHKFKMYTILIDFKKKEYQDIQELSDEVYHVQGGNWSEEISEKLFSI